MPIFQTSVLKKFLKQQDDVAIATAYKAFTSFFHNTEIQQNIKDSKEEQFQAKFLDELFVAVLGYTLSPQPSFNLTTEFKNIKNSRKADGAVLRDEKAIAVIELKSTKTKDLESIRQQAFDYKANQPECVYVITSNFEKIRFYINNAVDFEEFDLFTLSQERFRLLYLCLHKDNLLNDVPLKIKEASIVEEESITKKFYADYSLFRRELYRDVVKRNSRNAALKELTETSIKKALFNKTQKLLDRFLFVLFGEDRGLLPPNSIPEILKQWEKLKDLDAYVPLYERYQKYFGYLNTGWKGKDHDIFAYNGGLFKPDPLLDSIEIDDELLFKHTSKLTAYDFESQVDVNILGHIFEHSLNEIESVNAEIEGVEFDKQKTKRKKDGVFYTPKYITKYIVDNTVGKLCEDKKTELGIAEESYLKGRKNRPKDTVARLNSLLDTYREWMLTLTICDPACGSGAFLNQALDFLIAEHQWIDEMRSKLMGGGLAFPDIENSILEKNIYGVDLNEESVEIAKLSLWLRTSQPGRKLTSLNNNIKCGNSLIESKAVAGDKAFVWEKEFPEVFAKGGFDVVIGNPPYVRKQGLMEYYPEMCTYYEQQFTSATANYDIYALFMERSYNWINQTGVVSFILPHKFLVTDFGLGIRKFFKEKQAVESIIHFGSEIVFAEASTYTCIINLSKKAKERVHFKKLNPQELTDPFDWDYTLYSNLDESNWDLQSQKDFELIEKLNEQPHTVGEVFERIFVGAQTSMDKVFVFKGTAQGTVLKAYNESYDHHFEIERAMVKPYIKGSDIAKYGDLNSEWFVLFPYESDEEKIIPMSFEMIDYNFPLAARYLRTYEDKLRSREKSRFNTDTEWFLFGRKQGIAGVEVSKIMTQEISFGCNLTYDASGEFYHATTVYSFVKRKQFNVHDKFYLGIMNSKVLWFFLKNTGTELRGGYFRFKTNYLKPFPLPAIPKNPDEIISRVDKMLELNKEMQATKGKFYRTILREFNLEKLSRKLEEYNELSFDEFLKELKKQKVLLSLEQKDEWEDYFLKSKEKAQSLQSQINQTDREINQMVYELYGLTEEEIKIVEGSL